MSHSRSADATIRGFLFQFQETVIQLFDSDEKITVEGLDQDIELENLHIQCKYYKDWSNSDLSKTIKPIYKHFLENKNNLNLKYQLNLHVSDTNKSKNIADIQNLKYVLGLGGEGDKLKFEELELSESNLEAFISKFAFRESNTIEENELLMSQKLAKTIGLKSGNFLYSAVIGEILKISSTDNIGDRSIDQSQFKQWLGSSTQILAMEWLLARENESKYNKQACKIFKENLHANSIIRINVKNVDVDGLKQFLQIVLKKANNAPCTFPIICLDIDQSLIINLKDDLYESDKTFYDEYPFLGCKKPKFKKILESNRYGHYEFISESNLLNLINDGNRNFSLINFYEISSENFSKQQVNIPINSFIQLLNIIK